MTTLELDVQITQDGHAVVTHDRQVSAAKCRDTGPAFPGDPEYPYVGDYVTNLTLEQVWTLDCGSQRLAAYPDQQLVPGARLPLLSQVFALVDCYKATRSGSTSRPRSRRRRLRRPRRGNSSCRSSRARSARPACSTG